MATTEFSGLVSHNIDSLPTVPDYPCMGRIMEPYKAKEVISKTFICAFDLILLKRSYCTLKWFRVFALCINLAQMKFGHIFAWSFTEVHDSIVCISTEYIESGVEIVWEKVTSCHLNKCSQLMSYFDHMHISIEYWCMLSSWSHTLQHFIGNANTLVLIHR